MDFDPVGFEPCDFIVDKFFSNPAAIREGGHAGDGGGVSRLAMPQRLVDDLTILPWGGLAKA